MDKTKAEGERKKGMDEHQTACRPSIITSLGVLMVKIKCIPTKQLI
jgi:hypothetical protein